MLKLYLGVDRHLEVMHIHEQGPAWRMMSMIISNSTTRIASIYRPAIGDITNSLYLRGNETENDNLVPIKYHDSHQLSIESCRQHTALLLLASRRIGEELVFTDR